MAALLWLWSARRQTRCRFHHTPLFLAHRPTNSFPSRLPPTNRAFFLNGKTLPIDRGGGIDQPVIGVVARRLAAGDWLHVYPEGRVQPAGDVGGFKQVGLGGRGRGAGGALFGMQVGATITTCADQPTDRAAGHREAGV